MRFPRFRPLFKSESEPIAYLPQWIETPPWQVIEHSRRSSAAKMALRIRAVLLSYCFPRHTATIVYGRSVSVRGMSNERAAAALREAMEALFATAR
jgi:hypothetical protein